MDDRPPDTRATAGEALLALMLEAISGSHKLRAWGARLGAVTPWGGGIWGLLRSLRLEGPQTVPQAARARPVARQHIQRIANDAEKEGLLEFVDNPAHRRSKLMRLTPQGEAFVDELNAKIREAAEELATGMDAEDLRKARAVLADANARLDRAL